MNLTRRLVFPLDIVLKTHPQKKNIFVQQNSILQNGYKMLLVNFQLFYLKKGFIFISIQIQELSKLIPFVKVNYHELIFKE